MILSENKVVRLFSFFLLYIGQGLPLGVSTVAFPAWLVANGASEADVGAIIATAFLPWSFKFIPAAVAASARPTTWPPNMKELATPWSGSGRMSTAMPSTATSWIAEPAPIRNTT